MSKSVSSIITVAAFPACGRRHEIDVCRVANVDDRFTEIESVKVSEISVRMYGATGTALTFLASEIDDLIGALREVKADIEAVS